MSENEPLKNILYYKVKNVESYLDLLKNIHSVNINATDFSNKTQAFKDMMHIPSHIISSGDKYKLDTIELSSLNFPDISKLNINEKIADINIDTSKVLPDINIVGNSTKISIEQMNKEMEQENKEMEQENKEMEQENKYYIYNCPPKYKFIKYNGDINNLKNKNMLIEISTDINEDKTTIIYNEINNYIKDYNNYIKDYNTSMESQITNKIIGKYIENLNEYVNIAYVNNNPVLKVIYKLCNIKKKIEDEIEVTKKKYNYYEQIKNNINEICEKYNIIPNDLNIQLEEIKTAIINLYDDNSYYVKYTDLNNILKKKLFDNTIKITNVGIDYINNITELIKICENESTYELNEYTNTLSNFIENAKNYIYDYKSHSDIKDNATKIIKIIKHINSISTNTQIEKFIENNNNITVLTNNIKSLNEKIEKIDIINNEIIKIDNNLKVYNKVYNTVNHKCILKKSNDSAFRNFKSKKKIEEADINKLFKGCNISNIEKNIFILGKTKNDILDFLANKKKLETDKEELEKEKKK